MKQSIELNGKSYDAPAVLQERFGININTVTRWVERGLLPTPIKIGRHHYFQRDLVDDFLSRGEARSSTESRRTGRNRLEAAATARNARPERSEAEHALAHKSAEREQE